MSATRTRLSTSMEGFRRRAATGPSSTSSSSSLPLMPTKNSAGSRPGRSASASTLRMTARMRTPRL
ncbi:hypothetical protein WP1_312 [Pseudomonas phage WP1]